MNSCGQACPYNTLNGCKVKEYNEICPLTNMATPITEYRMTNADRIRAMSDEELAEFIRDVSYECQDAYCGDHCQMCAYPWCNSKKTLEWLKQPAEGEDND